MSGRIRKVTKEKYLDAVKKTKTISDKAIAKHIGVNRSNVTRFRNSNPDVLEKANKIILRFTSVIYDAKNISFETFEQIPIIEKWVEIQKGRLVSKGLIRSRLRALYNVTRHINVHPENLTLDMCVKLVSEAKTTYYKDEKFIRGLAYLNIRKPIRSFFQLIHGISGELLSSVGIDAESSKGVGSASKERVTKEQRAMFSKVLEKAVYDTIHDPEYRRFKNYAGQEKQIYTEMKGITYFMYYSATRIGSTEPNRLGSLSIRLNNPRHQITKNKWIINIKDKGEKGGIEWNKLMLDDAVTKMREYVSERFDIPIDEVEVRMKTIDSFMFPILNKNYNFERRIMKRALMMSGVVTRNPNHIWRHTFAQDCLHATDWNYELVASIGGWKDTGTLKKHYGEMSEMAKERGLRQAMKITVEDVTYELRW